MTKKYNNSWSAKKLTINFNQKQWRQDLASFIQHKKYWNYATVTRSKSVTNNVFHKGSRFFEIFDGLGNSIKVQYKNECEVEFSNEIELIKEYLSSRS